MTQPTERKVSSVEAAALYAAMSGVSSPVALESMRRAAVELERLTFILDRAAPRGWRDAAQAEWERLHE